jgi:hypothetical protein
MTKGVYPRTQQHCENISKGKKGKKSKQNWKNPDFIKKQKESRGTKPNKNDNPQDRINHFKQYGF